MSRESDLAWAAGIVDGEGCIALHKTHTHTGTAYVIRLTVVNTSSTMLTRLKEIFAVGKLNVHRKAAGNHRLTWNWSLTAKKAEQVLTLIEPYLVNKREEARLALYSRSLIGQHGRNTQNPNVVELETLITQISARKKVA